VSQRTFSLFGMSADPQSSEAIKGVPPYRLLLGSSPGCAKHTMDPTPAISIATAGDCSVAGPITGGGRPRLALARTSSTIYPVCSCWKMNLERNVKVGCSLTMKFLGWISSPWISPLLPLHPTLSIIGRATTSGVAFPCIHQLRFCYTGPSPFIVYSVNSTAYHRVFLSNGAVSLFIFWAPQKNSTSSQCKRIYHCLSELY
jgi:hypothetical protein